nr:hypothetical protein [Tanacetum cinerariifolium]
GTLKGKWRYLIPAKPPIHNHVLIPNYQDFKIQDFRYSDGFECFQAINIGRLITLMGVTNEGSDNNKGSDHNEGSDNNEGSDHNEGSDNNKVSDDNDKSDDSDFKCDIEDRIDDVHVDMKMFKDNIDPNVEWVSSTKPEPQAENNENLVYEEVDLEDFDNEINSDDDEAERRKALRKLGKCHKPVDGNTYTENFYISQTFPNKDLIKDMVTKISVRTRRELHLIRNDNERVRAECRGIVPCFSNSGPNEDRLVDDPNRQKGLIPSLAETFLAAKHRYCLKHIHDNMKLQWRGQQFKDLLWKCATATTVSYFKKNIEELKARPHFDVLLNNMCEVLNRQLKDGRDNPIITCLEFIREYLMKRIVIVQHVIRKSNGPLSPKATKEEMYRFKINPCNGPDLWPPSDSPITYTLPEYHKPVGRPSKKRKKSVAELFDGLVKNGKLSRFGQTVTCCKFGKEGHNSRTCKGQRGATSAPAVNQTQTTQTTVNLSAPSLNPSQITQTTVNSPS